jgi:hypothetical protein
MDVPGTRNGGDMALRAPGAWTVAAVAAVAGGVAGAGGAMFQASLLPWRMGELIAVPLNVSSDAPRVEVTETTYLFGTIGTGTSGSHRFEIRNAGERPLTLSRGSSSCSCTVSDFDVANGASADSTKVVPPGERTFVTVKWQGKPPGGPFRQQVTIVTDDPRRPEVVFAVEGTIVPTWLAVPESLSLDQFSTSSSQQASATIYTFGPQPPEVDSVVIDGPDADRFFVIKTTNLSAEEVATQPEATGGFRIDVEVKSGLPIGPLRRTITSLFKMPEEVTASLPVQGNVSGDLTFAGAGWDAARQTLVLGTVSGRHGFKRKVFLTAKGEYRELVRPVVREVVPESLEVTVGEGAPVGAGNVLRFPVDIEVRPGSRPANHLCSEQGPAGKIVFGTGHPDTPTLSIPVCIAIGP